MADDLNPVRLAWNANAEHWDARMAEGNMFALQLVASTEEKLLDVRPGDRILEVACGNGLHARRLARRGAKVVAIDISSRMIELARARTPADLAVDYQVIDAAEASELRKLPSAFDAVICHMAIFNMSRIDPFFAAAAERLAPGAPLIVSSVHPCFNQPNASLFAEIPEEDGTARSSIHGVRLSGYGVPRACLERAFDDQPVSQPLFHRPLSVITGEAFEAGFVLTGLIEPAPAKDGPVGETLRWDSRYSHIPPVIVFRFERRPAAGRSPSTK